LHYECLNSQKTVELSMIVSTIW